MGTNPPKLDLGKLQQSLSTYAGPSEQEGSKKDYGDSYKSPYSKRIDLPKKRSAPTILQTQHKRKTKVSHSPNRMSIAPKSTAEPHTGQSPEAPTKLPHKSSAVSGFFTSADTEKPKSTYMSPLMTAPSMHTQGKLNNGVRFSGGNLPPPLIPPKPVKTEALPPLSPSIVIRPKGGSLHKKVVTVQENASLFSSNGRGNKRISLLVDPAKTRSLHDGSVDLNLDEIAFAKFIKHDNYDDDEEDDDYKESLIDFFQKIKQMESGDDSLQRIREPPPKEITVDSTCSYTRIKFFLVFTIYLISAFLAVILTHLFIFHFNYGFETESENVTNSTLQHHVQIRHILNMHMYLAMVPCMQLLQFGTLLYRLFPRFSRTTMKWIHALTEIAAAGSRFASSHYSLRYLNTARLTDTHGDVYSMHSYVGILSMTISLFSLLTGLTNIVPCCSWETRVTLTPMHRSAGNLLVISDTAVMLTGCIQMADKYFATIQFPELYPDEYSHLPPKAIVLNMIGITTLLAAGTVMYLHSHYDFRRKQKSDKDIDKQKDLDLEAIMRVTERRHFKDLAREAREHGRTKGSEEIQIGSRKSFNLAAKQKYWKSAVATKATTNDEKSIPALINQAEKEKANFTDMDCKLTNFCNDLYLSSIFHILKCSLCISVLLALE